MKKIRKVYFVKEENAAKVAGEKKRQRSKVKADKVKITESTIVDKLISKARF